MHRPLLTELDLASSTMAINSSPLTELFKQPKQLSGNRPASPYPRCRLTK